MTTPESQNERLCTICDKPMTGLVCKNKWCNEIHVQCSTCEVLLNQSDAYEYRGFIFCQKHFHEGVAKVEEKRQEVIEITKASTHSQASGEWHNGGYKTMRTDIWGNPMPNKLKEPQILQDYENGIL